MQTTEAQNGLYCGADLHGNNVFLTLCDLRGQRVMERRVKANLKAVNTALEPYGDRVKQVAVESTYNWYWLVDGLRSQGRDVRLANPATRTRTVGRESPIYRPACRQGRSGRKFCVLTEPSSSK